MTKGRGETQSAHQFKINGTRIWLVADLKHWPLIINEIKAKTIMEILKAETHHFDIEELACKILGLDYDEIDADTQVIEDKMSEEFYIDLDTFQEIVSRLLPLVDVGASELTGTRFKGFADVKNKKWLVKTEVSN